MTAHAETSIVAPELLAELAARAGRPDFPRLEAQLRSSGYCARPVRLQGHVEVCEGGRRRRVWSTDTEPDQILRKACGNRREAVCPPCAERYRGDAYQLLAAGLRGGKGVPETVAEHPAVFVTFTAPSFGLVHTRPLGPGGEPRRCRPRRDAPVCEHGVRLSCGAVHDEDDPRLGEPICLDCYDHAGAVIWNNALGELWRRTVPVYLPRTLAAMTAMTQARLRGLVRVSYVKVTEYQRRGLVHLHAVIRLDRAMPKYRADEVRPPDTRFTTELLEDAIRETVDAVSAPLPDELGGGRVRWGNEFDVRALVDGSTRSEVAGYLAKYATKSTEQAGGLLHPIDREQADTAPVREHVREYLRAAFRLNDACQAAATQRAAADASRRSSVPPGAETARDGNLLARRAAQAMSRGERVRLRMRRGAEHVGRIVRWSPTRTPAELGLDTGRVLPIAEVKVIATARRARRDRHDRRLAKCVHAFGYRGHCLTKSRRYSTTFKALREARERHVHEQLLARSHHAAQRTLAELDPGERIASFRYVGRGHVTAADALLAASAAARAREGRAAARLERATAIETGGRA
ncbi:MAG: replication initiator [Solirubrobacteraceae bacterium]